MLNVNLLVISTISNLLINRYLSLNLRMEGKALKFSFSQIIPKLVISLALISIFYLKGVMFDGLLYVYLLSNIVLLVYLLIENLKIYNFLNLFEKNKFVTLIFCLSIHNINLKKS